MSSESKKLSVLQVFITRQETCCAYNEHCLPMRHERDITICSYFPSEMEIPSELALYEGNGSISGFMANLKKALRRKEYDIIHLHSPHVGLMFILTCLMLGKYYRQTVYTVHNSFQNYKPRNQYMMMPVFMYFRKIVMCSKSALESFPSFYKWLGKGKFHVVQNAVDLDRIETVIARNKSAKRNPQFTIATIGRVIEIKNYFTLLQAFSKAWNGETKMVCIGEGHLREKLNETAASLGLADHWKVTGLISRDDVFRIVSNADLFVSASRGEGLPVAVMEAMACGCPVILSDIPPHREIAEGIDFIPLLDTDDVEGFSREIQRFQEMSPAERKQIGQKCSRLIQERFSVETMQKGMAKVYDLALVGN